MNGRVLLVLLGAGLAMPAAAQLAPVPTAAADSARTAWTTVSYRTGESIYLDAGTRAGLAPGMAVQVVRGGGVIADLQVAYVSSNRASCTVVRSSVPVAVGDSARFAAPPVRPEPAEPAPGASATRGARTRPGALRGRLGLRYFVTDYALATTSSISQPAMDARLDGQHLGGTPLGLSLDVRANRTSGGSGAGPATSTRVYQAALHIDGTAVPGRLTVGRQFSTALSTVGLFDGIAADFTWRHTGAGLFAGSQPDAVDFGMSGAIREYGAYGRVHSAPGSPGIWSLTTGLIGSYARGEVNREFLYLQGMYVHRQLSLYAAQEVDYNRAWKAEAEGRRTTPTSTFATARVALGPLLAVSAGYDNRRNVRLYRDFVSPDVAFDDSFRQGVWGGAQLTLGSHVQAGYDLRASRGGSSGASDSWTATARASRLTPLGLGARVRVTRYAGALLEGTLQGASLEVQPAGRFRLDLSAGTRHDVRPLEGTTATELRWLGADFDVGIGRALYLTFSTYQERSADGRMLQHFGSLSYRF